MARDALEPGELGPDGKPEFPNLPRLPDGTPDWGRLGSVPPEFDVVDENGRRHRIDPKPSIPDPTDPQGRPIRPS